MKKLAMKTLCLKCKKIQKTKIEVSKTNKNKTMLLSKCAMCSSKRSMFIKKIRSKWKNTIK